jgi:hypothetical protein
MINSITSPTSGTLGVTLAEAKEHLRVYHSIDDASITSFIYAATAFVEEYLSYPLVPTTRSIEFYRYNDTSFMRLPVSKVTAITSLSKWDDSDWEVIDSSNLYLQSGGIYFLNGMEYRTDTLLKLVVVCGLTAPTVLIKQAILMLVNHYYESRESVTVKAGLFPVVVPLGTQSILSMLRER